MAQVITAPLKGDFISGPGMVIPLADQTGTTAVQQFVGSGNRAIQVRRVNVMVYLKTFVVGTGTVYPMFSLEVSDVLAFNSGNRRIATYQPPLLEAIAAIPGTNMGVSFYLEAFCPDGGKGFVRIATTFNGTSSGTYDAIIAGA